MSLSSFFEADEARQPLVVTRAGSARKVRFRGRGGFRVELLADAKKGKLMEPLLVDLASAREEVPLQSHAGQEFNYMLEGRCAFLFGKDRIELETGDAIYFDASVPHVCRALGSRTLAAPGRGRLGRLPAPRQRLHPARRPMSRSRSPHRLPVKPLRFAILGTGFWARYQLAAWRELPGAECVALYNRTRAKAEALGREFGITAIYDDPAELFARAQIDFGDIITDVGTHARLTRLAAERHIPVICQKPMARTLREAEAMVQACQRRKVPFFVHENFRWQAPIRALAAELKRGAIGRPFRARIDFISGFPVFDNQPFLAELEQFIITDVGSHTLDVARFLFGEAKSLYCRTQRVHKNIKGEDVATIVLETRGGALVTVNMAYASNPLEREAFPETLIFVEGESGSAELSPGCVLRTTTRKGTLVRKVPPPFYPWADPRYAVVHSSIVDVQRQPARRTPRPRPCRDHRRRQSPHRAASCSAPTNPPRAAKQSR